MGEVYEARDKLDGVVALKRVLEGKRHIQRASVATVPMDVGPSLLELMRQASETAGSPFGRTATAPNPVRAHGPEQWRIMLMREFRVLASLRHPHIISVLDYGFDQDLNPYYTMELLQDARSIVDAGKAQPREVQLRLIAELLQALVYLHRRGIVHRDLKPSNILVAGGHVKVLDFGIAIDENEEAPLPAGTVAYMAPETLLGFAPSASSDLYAVGLVAYELLVGGFPYDLKAHLAPALQALSAPVRLEAVDPSLQPLLRMLLAVNVEARCKSASEALDEVRRISTERIVVETLATRESFLRTATLVGRDVELAVLRGMLNVAIGGEGRSVLVAGSSGVGKSRLLEELRVHALVNGVIVLRGEEVSAGGGSYQVWQDILRRLVLQVEPSSEEAAVLKPLVPGIDALLGRPITDAPSLDAEMTQHRVFSVVRALFGRLGKPAMVLLDDVQWSGGESIKLLERVVRDAQNLPLLVVAAYRDDEAAALRETLPEMNVLALSRLDVSAVSALSLSMLGERGRDPELLKLLVREGEGLPFFLVEAVRALAEEAGELDKISIDVLPRDVVSGGAERLVQRRLARVPAWAAWALRAAAVLGRSIEPNVLARVVPALEIGPWLSACTEAGVLDVHHGAWRFVHDKLREGLIAQLTADERRTLNRAAAEAIEAAHPRASQRHRALAFHWEAAGVPSKAIDHYEIAGQRALTDFANREAITCFQKAVALDDAEGGKASPLRRGQWHRGLSEAHFLTGEEATGIRYARIALELFGEPMTDSVLGGVAAIAREVPLRVARSYVPAKEERSSERRAALREATATYTSLIMHFFLRGDPLNGTVCGLRAMELGERIEPTGPLAHAYGFMTIVVGMGQLDRVAESWARRAVEIAEQSGGGPTLAYALARTSCYFLACAKWTEATARLLRGLQIAQMWGDLRCMEEIWATLFVGESHFGLTADALALAQAEQRSAEARGDEQMLNWARTHLVDCGARIPGDTAHLLASDAMLPWLERVAGDSEATYAYGVMARAALGAGDASRARAYADRALALMRRSPPTAYFVLGGVVGAADAYLSLLETGASGRRALEASAAETCDLLDGLSRKVPIGAPAAHRSRGRLLWSRREPLLAIARWRTSLELAQRFGMRFEEAETRALLALHGPAIERSVHEARREALLSELAAPSSGSAASAGVAPRRSMQP